MGNAYGESGFDSGRGKKETVLFNTTSRPAIGQRFYPLGTTDVSPEVKWPEHEVFLIAISCQN
jgi:hypothetical protein